MKEYEHWEMPDELVKVVKELEDEVFDRSVISFIAGSAIGVIVTLLLLVIF